MKNVLAVSGVPLPRLPDGFEYLLLSPDATVAPEVSCHADMIFTVFEKKVYFHSTYYEKYPDIVEYIAGYGGLELIIADDERSPLYPMDVGLNALEVDGKLLCHYESLCNVLKTLPIINTKQGYAACTSLYAADTVISADKSTLKACREAGIPTYAISGRDILLPGYDTGFIGGACATYGNCIYIYGDPVTSQSAMELLEFCKMKGLSLVSLSDGPVTDIGGIKFIDKKD